MASKNVKIEFPKNIGLYVITDLNLAAPKKYYEIAKEVLLGGAKVIQIRDKQTPFEALVEECRKVKTLCDEFGALLIINDNPYLAKEADAHGVHLGQNDTPVQIAREIVGPNKIIGLSTHNKVQAIQACYMSVDYIGIGPIFNTTTKVSEYETLGVDICSWAKKQLSMPFVAIGGINQDNIKDLIKAGAENIAVISAIMSSKDIQKTVSEFINTMSMLKEVSKQ